MVTFAGGNVILENLFRSNVHIKDCIRNWWVWKAVSFEENLEKPIPANES